MHNLLYILSQLHEKNAYHMFFECFLTPKERKELELRLAILKRLLDGESQRSIAHSLGISVTTVTRGSKALKECSQELKDLILASFSHHG